VTWSPSGRPAAKHLSPDHPDSLRSTEGLAHCYWLLQRVDKSVPLYEDLLKRREATFGRQHRDTLKTVANLGVNYAAAGRLDEALALLEESYRASEKYPGLRRWVGVGLADGYVRTGRTAQVAGLAKELIDDDRRTVPPDSPQLGGKLAQRMPRHSREA
jgi:eukaryotic-like serine/threonine-protein kinase